jgi:hypothetical protein
MSEHIVEYEDYYEEEEVLSYYDPGLSTISEGENESCSDTSSTLEASKSPRQQIGSAFTSTSTSIPDNISLNLAMMNILSLDSPCISLSSPRMSSKVNNFNIAAALISPPLADKKFQSSACPKLKSPIVTNLPLTLTSYMTGEEVILDDDDDYTFMSCSDTDSHIDELSMSFTDLSVASTGSVRSISSKGSCKGSLSIPLDFESTRSRIRNALENRTTREKNCVEKMDFLQRRLTYDLSRKMFKEQMARSRARS